VSPSRFAEPFALHQYTRIPGVTARIAGPSAASKIKEQVTIHAPMQPPTLVISKIGLESDILLRNLFQYYCHDMSQWFELDTGADGRYSYDTASVWAKGCDAYLAQVDGSIAGFALIGSGGEWLGDIGAHDVQEFFIMRRFRRRGIGRSLATFLWNEFPGDWLVRVLEANTSAINFWRSGISIYSLGSYIEEQRTVNGRSWKFFRFVSHGRKSGIASG
jgi:predicted acetyltransferase